MVLGDPLWEDAEWGESEKLKDPSSGEVAKRNPFVNIPDGARHSLTWPDGALDTLMQRGVIVLACDLALRNAASLIASRRKIPRADALQLVAQHLLPGVYRMPSGIFATAHAQQLGCGVLNSV
jgi:intracellular sulfur oxidation DsrE/DsrF family protein